MLDLPKCVWAGKPHLLVVTDGEDMEGVVDDGLVLGVVDIVQQGDCIHPVCFVALRAEQREQAELHCMLGLLCLHCVLIRQGEGGTESAVLEIEVNESRRKKG
jgi:hypothetical protein